MDMGVTKQRYEEIERILHETDQKLLKGELHFQPVKNLIDNLDEKLKNARSEHGKI